MNDNEYLRRQLIWRCRRGLLEVGVMLEKFIDSAAFQQLDQQQLELLAELLELPEADLLEFLVYQLPAPDRLTGLVELIRRSNGIATFQPPH